VSRKRDYEYKRNGTANLFLAVEPKGGNREVTVTERRTKTDFAREMRRIATLPRYRKAKKLHVVLDNLNTHFESSFYETFAKAEATHLLRRFRFHYTPKHASWLNMAEIELSILSRQALRGRIPSEHNLQKRVRTWQQDRNRKHAMIHWTFTKQDARNVFKYKVQN
jgi:transposase